MHENSIHTLVKLHVLIKMRNREHYIFIAAIYVYMNSTFSFLIEVVRKKKDYDMLSRYIEDFQDNVDTFSYENISNCKSLVKVMFRASRITSCLDSLSLKDIVAKISVQTL